MRACVYVYVFKYVCCMRVHFFSTRYDTADMRKSLSADPDRKHMQPRGGPPMKPEELDD
jgi:hypothetical protein